MGLTVLPPCLSGAISQGGGSGKFVLLLETGQMAKEEEERGTLRLVSGGSSQGSKGSVGPVRTNHHKLPNRGSAHLYPLQISTDHLCKCWQHLKKGKTWFWLSVMVR